MKLRCRLGFHLWGEGSVKRKEPVGTRPAYLETIYGRTCSLCKVEQEGRVESAEAGAGAMVWKDV